MFIHFLCLCPLRLAIMLNFNISKVAYYVPPLHGKSGVVLIYMLWFNFCPF